MARYAHNTSVSVERSQEEIKNTLRRYGASAFGSMERDGLAMIMFEFKHLAVRLTVEIPDRAEFTETETGKARADHLVDKAHEQAIKQRWRALCLAIRAKLEAVECGISTIEQEFMPFVVMKNGQTLSDMLVPRLAELAMDPRKLDRLLPNLPAEKVG